MGYFFKKTHSINNVLSTGKVEQKKYPYYNSINKWIQSWQAKNKRFNRFVIKTAKTNHLINPWLTPPLPPFMNMSIIFLNQFSITTLKGHTYEKNHLHSVVIHNVD